MTSGRVLVLDGQTNQALACVRSLGRAGYSVFTASDRRRPLAAWSRFCRGSVRLAGETREGCAALREWATQHGIATVLPITERACLLLNLERAAWEHAGITVGCAPDDVLVRAFDKARTLRLAREAGVATPVTHMPESLAECATAAQAVGFPCVVKPRFSNFWDGNRFVPTPMPRYANNPEELATIVSAYEHTGQWPLVQAFVPGRGRGVFALCDHGQAVAWFAHERLRDIRPSGSGSALRRSIPLKARLRDPATRLLSALEWHGPAMVEFRDDGRSAPVLMEVNGRFWGSLQLAISAGVDFPRLWAAILAHQHVEPCLDYASGVTVRWLWGDVKRLLYVVAGRPRGYPGSFPTLWEGLRAFLGPQPAGTQLEIWDRRDPWPALGEWVEGLRDVLKLRSRTNRVSRRTAPAVGHATVVNH